MKITPNFLNFKKSHEKKINQILFHSIKFKKFQFKTLSQYLQENDYYTYADVHSELVLPRVGFDK